MSQSKEIQNRPKKKSRVFLAKIETRQLIVVVSGTKSRKLHKYRHALEKENEGFHK